MRIEEFGTSAVSAFIQYFSYKFLYEKARCSENRYWQKKAESRMMQILEYELKPAIPNLDKVAIGFAEDCYKLAKTPEEFVTSMRLLAENFGFYEVTTDYHKAIEEFERLKKSIQRYDMYQPIASYYI